MLHIMVEIDQTKYGAPKDYFSGTIPFSILYKRLIDQIDKQVAQMDENREQFCPIDGNVSLNCLTRMISKNSFNYVI
jgi:hypothetical protein